jgi:hypothetical protein
VADCEACTSPCRSDGYPLEIFCTAPSIGSHQSARCWAKTCVCETFSNNFHINFLVVSYR